MCCKCQNDTSFIANPDQMEFIGFETRFTEKYNDGFHTGISWDANWMPGGPWVYEGKNAAERENSRLEAAQWLKGFDDGLTMRLKTNSHFAAWWTANRGKILHSPGVDISQIRYKEPEECFPEYHHPYLSEIVLTSTL